MEMLGLNGEDWHPTRVGFSPAAGLEIRPWLPVGAECGLEGLLRGGWLLSRFRHVSKFVWSTSGLGRKFSQLNNVLPRKIRKNDQLAW